MQATNGVSPKISPPMTLFGWGVNLLMGCVARKFTGRSNDGHRKLYDEVLMSTKWYEIATVIADN